jgi:recombinational DNA repair ATPase RecF
MFVSKLYLKNWRNFREAEINLIQSSYLLGPNASGKSKRVESLRRAKQAIRQLAN